MKKILKSSKQTQDFAFSFAKNIKKGETIALEGDLGAGKTTFTQGLAVGFGIKETITSPTFVLMKVYTIKNSKHGLKRLVHLDAYRLDSADEAMALGLLEYLEDEQTIVVIEWPEKIRVLLPKDTKWVKISLGDNENSREVVVL